MCPYKDRDTERPVIANSLSTLKNIRMFLVTRFWMTITITIMSVLCFLLLWIIMKKYDQYSYKYGHDTVLAQI